jgi:hypothetical protein
MILVKLECRAIGSTVVVPNNSCATLGREYSGVVPDKENAR